MKRYLSLAAAVPAAVFFCGSLAAHDNHRAYRFEADLKPTKEVPALSSAASGTFKARIDEGNQVITYELTYEGLEGNVLQAHIHLAQPGVNGGVSVFLCGNPPTVPAATARGLRPRPRCDRARSDG